jgi:hypothetical protein
VTSTFVDLKPRKINPPELTYGGNARGGTFRKDKDGNSTPGTWNMADVKRLLKIGNPLPKLCIIRLCSKLDAGNINGKSMLEWLQNDLMHLLKSQLKKHGLTTAQVQAVEALVPVDMNSTVAMRTEMGDNLTEAWGMLGNPDFVMVQLPNKKASTYASLKWWGDCHQGVRTVCVLEKKFSTNMGKELNMLSNFA